VKKQATGLAQSVTVANTPLPVREQNVDGGNIKVHQQRTVNVASAPASKHDWIVALGDNSPTAIGPLNASVIIVRMRSDAHVSAVRFSTGAGMVFDLSGPIAGASANAVVPLTQPIPISQVELQCTDNVNCEADVQAVGS
jgi:hypothetical protein